MKRTTILVILGALAMILAVLAMKHSDITLQTGSVPLSPEGEKTGGKVFLDWNGNGVPDSAGIRDIRLFGLASHENAAGEIILRRSDGTERRLSPRLLERGLPVGTLEGRAMPGDSHFRHHARIIVPLKPGVFARDASLPVRIAFREGVHITLGAGADSVEWRDPHSAARLAIVRRVVAKGGRVEIRLLIANTGLEERGVPGIVVIDESGAQTLSGPDGTFSLPAQAAPRNGAHPLRLRPGARDPHRVLRAIRF